VGKITHDAPHVALVNVREEALINPVVGRVFERRSGRPRERLNVSVSIEGQNGNMRQNALLEALPTLVKQRRLRGGSGQGGCGLHGHETGLVKETKKALNERDTERHFYGEAFRGAVRLETWIRSRTGPLGFVV